MSDRKRWSQPVTCQQCGAEGNATFSHDEGAIMTSESFAMDNVSGPFALERLGRTADETRFRCETCGTIT